MGKVKKTKFYRPGTLEVLGTKIVLKTQPYTNGVLFDQQDPISSFRQLLILMKAIVSQYDTFIQIPGIDSYMFKDDVVEVPVSSIDRARIKLLLDYLIESPTEIILKEQQITDNLIADAQRGAIESERAE